MRKLITWAAAALGIIFLVIPLAADSYAHYLQNRTFQLVQEKVLTCRAQLALSLFNGQPNFVASGLLSKSLDTTCGLHPRIEDYAYPQSGILSLYSWLGQHVPILPL